MQRLLLGLFAVWLLACASESKAPPARVPQAAEVTWLAPLDRQHPLVGKIWDQKAERFVVNKLSFTSDRNDGPRHATVLNIGSQYGGDKLEALRRHAHCFRLLGRKLLRMRHECAHNAENGSE